jgi:hypothetical protein
MNVIQIKLLILVGLAVATRAQYLSTNANGVKSYKIDLDREPQERFKEVTLDFKEDTVRAVRFYTGFVPQPIMWSLEQALSLIWLPKLPEYYDEVVGIAKYLELDKRIMLIIQFVYDLSSFCTSIVAAEAGTGQVIHARNLDFLNSGIMRNITYEAQFFKNGKLLYRATMFAGLNGVMTGERPGGFSISLNSRNPSYRKNLLVLAVNIAAYITSAPQVTRVIRETFESCSDYECAFPMIKDTKMMAYAYLTIAGSKPYQGAIVARDRYGPAHVEELTSNGTVWFLSQTNDDHWKGICTERCQYPREALPALGRENLNPSNLINILKQYPSNNKYSIYNVLMMPSKSSEESIYLTELISNDGDAVI